MHNELDESLINGEFREMGIVKFVRFYCESTGGASLTMFSSVSSGISFTQTMIERGILKGMFHLFVCLFDLDIFSGINCGGDRLNHFRRITHNDESSHYCG